MLRNERRTERDPFKRELSEHWQRDGIFFLESLIGAWSLIGK